MGIYNRVKFISYCPGCGTRLNDFPTKDDEACLSDRSVEAAEEWHQECPECGLYIQFKHIHPSECSPRFEPAAFISITYARKS